MQFEIRDRMQKAKVLIFDNESHFFQEVFGWDLDNIFEPSVLKKIEIKRQCNSKVYALLVIEIMWGSQTDPAKNFRSNFVEMVPDKPR